MRFVGRAQGAVSGVEPIVEPRPGQESRDLRGLREDAPSDRVGTRRDLRQVGRHPAGPHAGIAIGRGDDPLPPPDEVQAAASFVHHEPPGRAHVRVRLVQRDFDQVQAQAGMLRGERADEVAGLVRAVVREDQDLVTRGVKPFAVGPHLARQRPQGRLDVCLFIVDRDGHAQLARRQRRRADQRPGSRGQSGEVERRFEQGGAFGAEDHESSKGAAAGTRRHPDTTTPAGGGKRKEEASRAIGTLGSKTR